MFGRLIYYLCATLYHDIHGEGVPLPRKPSNGAYAREIPAPTDFWYCVFKVYLYSSKRL